MEELFHRFAQHRVSHQMGTAFCGFEAWKSSQGVFAVRFTEYAENPGRSVTNAIEELADFAAASLQATGEKLIIAEHYPASSFREAETIAEVSFVWSGPQARDPSWHRRDRAWWHSLIAGADRVQFPDEITLVDDRRLHWRVCPGSLIATVLVENSR